MSTYFQWALNLCNDKEIGTSSSTRYTLVNGTPVFIGTDGDSNTGRVIPVTVIADHAAVGLARITTTMAQYAKYMAELALWPMRIITDNVDGTHPPVMTADNRVYLLDAATFASSDDSTANHFYGMCSAVFSTGEFNGTYELNLMGPSA